MAWPHNPETWPGCLDEAEEEFRELVWALGESEPVHLLVQDPAHAQHVHERLSHPGKSARVELHTVATDDAWIRDTGPTFALDTEGQLVAIHWEFNAWGGKYPPWDRDAAVGAEIGNLAGAEIVKPGLVVEGGALEIDGQGTLLATESTLVDPARNALARDALEAHLRDLLGVSRIVWLPGAVAGDDTDGHIDQLARFVAPGRVVCAVEPDRSDPNHEPLAACLGRLRETNDADGRRLEIVELPMPTPLEADGTRLPASYLNFYISNSSVLVPIFGVPADWTVMERLEPLFPGRKVMGLQCRNLVRGLGAIHCLTQQQPATP